jgi:hypothetical protein
MFPLTSPVLTKIVVSVIGFAVTRLAVEVSPVAMTWGENRSRNRRPEMTVLAAPMLVGAP